ncbi:nucleotidyltransferase domain-containing protein [Alkalihalobacillus sp. LMS39]|uniref:nucleotidyltransferase domain-containing protein n=1 Tax=Alkalihalobacillus sp. LMS39 TaxID=2924032 RepID=UPI001FB4C13C|nr:nucleotidyltransferase domain-containing protein [Alkalihalobacillus sp. LMS39]UOE95048.1 nucleotidyltransferase domain-containing protein [Alkalihalobacillus sp. LMS39]
MSEEVLLKKVTKYLKQKYNSHTVILYGSYCSGDFTAESDLDIVCFSDMTVNKNDISVFEDKQLDVWIYNTEKMDNPEQFLRVNQGQILLDDKGLAVELLTEIKNIFNNGPEKLSNEEKEFLKGWLRKMYLRSNKNDIEGDYRFHWMLKDSLEIYFELKDLWYLGPKKAISWLSENDEIAYNLFRNALAKDAKKKNIEQLLEYLSGI